MAKAFNFSPGDDTFEHKYICTDIDQKARALITGKDSISVSLWVYN